MAMERFRAQIMQKDQSGVYRVNTTNDFTNMSSNTSPLNSPSSPTITGLVAPPAWALSNSEASVIDHFGHPDGIALGQIFVNRKALYDAQVHRALVKGIVGTGPEGAFSVVVNDGYEDDIDEGDIIWYTGAGGQETRFGESVPQKADQDFQHPSNRALRRNTETKQPVRVIRGSKDTQWGPLRGYRYDGLYDVVSAEYTKGKSGYKICRFKLQRRSSQTPLKNLPRA